MLSLNEKIILILCCCYIFARLGDRFLLIRFAQDVLWEMPWNKWQTFNEIATATKVPRFYLRKIMFIFMHLKFVEFELDDTTGLSKEEMQRSVLEKINPKNGIAFVELFKYKRVIKPKRRRQKIALPSVGSAWSPARA